MDEVRCGQQRLPAKAAEGREGREAVEGVSSILAVTRRLQAKVELESKEWDCGGDGWWCAYMCVCVLEMELGGGVRFIKSDQQSFWSAYTGSRPFVRRSGHARAHTDGWTDGCCPSFLL